MSEKMLRVQLSEVTTFRIRCKKCGRGIIEVPVDRLDAALDKGECRLCGTELLPRGSDPLNGLRIAVEELLRAKDLGIEFEIPLP